MCEEFGCLPAEAIEAIETDVGFMLFKILDLRAYWRAKKAYEEDLHVPEMSKRRNSPLIEEVRARTYQLVKEKIERLKDNADSR